MLRRAFFLSAVFHLVLIFSLTSVVDWQRPNASTKGMEKLNMFITERAGDQVPAAPRIESAQDVQQSTKRKVGAPLASRPRDLKFDHFLPSTVGMAKSRSEKQPSQAIEATAELSSVSEAELGEYRLNVARSARQFKVYPHLAREMGWEGVVHIAVTWPIGPAGPIVSLGKSSGHAVLDHQALEMIRQAVGLTNLPDSMRGKNLTISLPVEYRGADR